MTIFFTICMNCLSFCDNKNILLRNYLLAKIIDIREEIDRKSQALNTRMRVPQFTYLRSPINNLSHVTKNVGFM